MDIASELADRFKSELLGKIVAVVSGAVLTVALARLLNPDDYGLLFLAISILGTIELFSKLGIAKSSARYIAEYKEARPNQLQHIIRFSFMLNIITIVVVGAVLLIVHRHLSNIIGEPDLNPLLQIGALFIAFSSLMTFVRVVLQGYESIKPAAILHATDRGLRLLFAVGFVLLGFQAVGALIGYIFAYFVSSTIGLFYIYIHHYRTCQSGAIETGLRRRIAEYTLPLTLTSTADVIDKRIDTVLVGFFIGPVAVAHYTLSRQVVQFVEAPIEALGFTLSPTYEAQKAKGNSKAAARIYEEALSYGLMLYIPAAAGLVLVSEPLISIIFGEDYLGAVPVLQVLAIYSVFQSVKLLTDNGLDFLGRARDRAFVKTVTAILNFILNIIFIPQIGVVGAALATVITDSIYTISNIYIMHKEIHINILGLSKSIINIIIITGIMSTIVYLTSIFTDGPMSLIMMVVTGLITWLTLVVGFGILDVNRVHQLLT